VGARSHKDLIAWQLADKLRREIYSLMSDGRAAADLRFRSQGEDAASSTCRNLAEGFARFNPREFAQYARYSAASNCEVWDVIEDGVARRYWTPEQVETAQNLQVRTAIALGRLQRYLRSKRAKENADRILARDENGR
jgi:four helix bundle protein